MIDYCHREGCQVYTVSRSVDSRPLLKAWYCSPVCKDVATRPMHWSVEDGNHVACGLISPHFIPHLATPDRSKVTCGICKRTAQWRKAEAA